MRAAPVLGWLMGLGLVLMVLPVLGKAALLPYWLLEWVGGWFVTGQTGGRLLGFRGGVTLAGVPAVLALLYVAVKDRDERYLAGAVGVFLALLLIMLVVAPAKRIQESAATSVEPPVSAQGPVSARNRGAAREDVPGRSSREEYERQAPGLIHGIAQAAARRQTGRVDTQLQWMAKWSESVPAGTRVGAATPDERQNRAEQLAGQARVEMVGLRGGSTPVDARIIRRLPRPPERVLVDVMEKIQAALLLTPEDGYLWLAYGYLLVDVDDEAAMGAMSIGIRLAPGSAEDGQLPDEWSDRLELMQARSAITRVRTHILLNRAWLAVLTEKELQPDASLLDYVEQVLPAPDPLEQGSLQVASLRASMPMAMPPEPVRGAQVDVDFDAAGICRDSRVLPMAVSQEGGTVVLVFDVLADGTVTGLLVDQPSGDYALDSAAVVTARRWCFSQLAGDAGDGERKRVPIHFQPGSPGPDGRAGVGDPPWSGEGHRVLHSLLQHQIRMLPPRYPASAVREGLEGRVLLEIRIGGDGVIRSAQLAESSGHPVLDRAAIEGARSWNVRPGEATSDVSELHVVVPVEFSLR